MTDIQVRFAKYTMIAEIFPEAYDTEGRSTFLLTRSAAAGSLRLFLSEATFHNLSA